MSYFRALRTVPVSDSFNSGLSKISNARSSFSEIGTFFDNSELTEKSEACGGARPLLRIWSGAEVSPEVLAKVLSSPAWLSDRSDLKRNGRRKNDRAARFTGEAPCRSEVRHARCAQTNGANPECFGQQGRHVCIRSACRLPRAMDL
jgi:hypothetical protein